MGTAYSPPPASRPTFESVKLQALQLPRDDKRLLAVALVDDLSAGRPGPSPAPAAEYCLTWAAILAALRGASPEARPTRHLVIRMNATYGGPIRLGRKGAQPFVVRAKLLDWWNDLERLVEEREQRRRDARVELADRYAYGRSGTVAPGIDGSVRPIPGRTA
jgi:hypothetical protein